MTLVDHETVSDRDRLLLATLPHVAFDGWSAAAIGAGAAAMGMSEAQARILFPGGGAEAIKHFIDLADRMMVIDLKRAITPDMRLRDKAALAVRLRLERWSSHREAVRRSLPSTVLRDPVRAAGALYCTVDAIWRGLGDRSIDFNFYSKRALLAVVYASTLMYWLDDRSDGCGATWSFLDRRIADVMQIPKLQQRVRDRLARLPDPMGLLRRLRPAS
jgi:ubiquinone biosynthesis protein COQ9